MPSISPQQKLIEKLKSYIEDLTDYLQEQIEIDMLNDLLISNQQLFDSILKAKTQFDEVDLNRNAEMNVLSNSVHQDDELLQTPSFQDSRAGFAGTDRDEGQKRLSDRRGE